MAYGVIKLNIRQNRYPDLYAYLDEPKLQAREAEWQLFCRLFLPLDFSVRVFWQVHFGIIGLDGTMKDKIALF